MSRNKSRTVNIRPTELANIITNKEENENIISTPPTINVKEENTEQTHESTSLNINNKEETKTVKLMDPKTNVVVPSSQKKQIPTPVLLIREYINNYISYFNQKGRKKSTESISKFKNIIIYALSHQEDAVLNEVYSFFKKNRNLILAPEIALQGIYTLPSSVQDKLQAVYMLFYHITGNDKKAKRLDLNHVVQVLGNGNLVSFVVKKMK